MCKQSKELVLITGGSSGIGKELGKEFIKRGYIVIITSSNKKKLYNTYEEIQKNKNGDNLKTIVCDVTKEEDVKDMITKVEELKVTVSILITCAGVSKSKDSERVMPYSIQELPKDEWDSILNVNLKGVFLTNKAISNIMKKQRYGQIINIGSSTTKYGLRGQPYAPAYCASKFAVMGLGKSLSHELEEYGITVQTICPGLVETPLTENTALKTLFDGKAMKPKNLAKSIADMIESNKMIKTLNPFYLPN